MSRHRATAGQRGRVAHSLVIILVQHQLLVEVLQPLLLLVLYIFRLLRCYDCLLVRPYEAAERATPAPPAPRILHGLGEELLWTSEQQQECGPVTSPSQVLPYGHNLPTYPRGTNTKLTHLLLIQYVLLLFNPSGPWPTTQGPKTTEHCQRTEASVTSSPRCPVSPTQTHLWPGGVGRSGSQGALDLVGVPSASKSQRAPRGLEDQFTTAHQCFCDEFEPVGPSSPARRGIQGMNSLRKRNTVQSSGHSWPPRLA